MICKQCGENIKDGLYYCPCCNSRQVTDNSDTPSSPTSDSVLKNTSSASHVQTASPDLAYCPFCGVAMSSKASFCPSCGKNQHNGNNIKEEVASGVMSGIYKAICAIGAFLNIPLILVIGLLNSERVFMPAGSRPGAWKDTMGTVISDEIKPVLLVILFIGIFCDAVCAGHLMERIHKGITAQGGKKAATFCCILTAVAACFIIYWNYKFGMAIING